MNLLSVENLALSVGDYGLSWIELVGTLLYFASVWLIARKNVWTWPVGMVSVMLYAVLFWQIQLYSDVLAQGYYFLVSLWGWAAWTRRGVSETALAPRFSSAKMIAFWALVTLAGGWALGFAASQVHLWLPALFPFPAAFPYIDALITSASFVAMFLLTKKRIESWVWWIVIDAASIGMYWVKGVRFIAAEYVFLLAMAVYGLLTWRKKS